RGHADLDDLAIREQRQVVGAALERGPTIVAIDDVQLAAVEALLLRRRAHFLERLVDEQRLVAGNEINAGEPLLEVPRQLPCGNPQAAARALAACRRDERARPAVMAPRAATTAWPLPRAARGCRRGRDRRAWRCARRAPARAAP